MNGCCKRWAAVCAALACAAAACAGAALEESRKASRADAWAAAVAFEAQAWAERIGAE